MNNRSKWLTAACVGAMLALAGCDEQQSEQAMGKLKAFFNAIKPDALLLKGLTPGVTTEAQVREMLSGHICRCTGYTPIVQAVLEVAALRGAQHDALEVSHA